ncbi:methyltransferase domain-containing protein [Glaciibacter sp. 2TAF33]|uniref:methyltransferase domain-containing protein n=1 Tax=Glaciibacter sp. 2TAF33 TaxID=3233015 RepID=UPI003F9276A0
MTGALTIGCDNGHSFDVNRRGFVSLVAGSRRLVSDSPQMLDARDRFLASGWYQPLQAAVTAVAASASPQRVLEVGCGTGYYLDSVCDAVPDAQCLGMDLSPAAVARTVRRSGRIDGLVADVWSPLPLRTGTAEVALVVFAPRNAPELQRVLAADGLLVIVIPADAHLQELRDAGLMISVQPGKASQLVKSLAGHFTLESTDRLEYTMDLGPGDVAALIGMGPSAHHTGNSTEISADSSPAADAEANGAGRTVTAAFELLRFRPLPVAPGSGSRTAG